MTENKEMGTSHNISEHQGDIINSAPVSEKIASPLMESLHFHLHKFYPSSARTENVYDDGHKVDMDHGFIGLTKIPI